MLVCGRSLLTQLKNIHTIAMSCRVSKTRHGHISDDVLGEGLLPLCFIFLSAGAKHLVDSLHSHHFARNLGAVADAWLVLAGT